MQRVEAASGVGGCAGGGLVVFFKAVCVYFAVGGGGGSPSLPGVAAKCAPVLCLMLLVLMLAPSQIQPRGVYARRVSLGLALSALGDAALAWPGPRAFAAGMAAFGAAHAAYLSALGWGGRRALGPAALLYAGTAVYVWCVRAPGALAPLVPLYALLLATMAWRAVARGGAAAAGALLFLLSDALLGYSAFSGPLPQARLLVMSTYYLAQLGLALSALPRPQPRAAPAHISTM